MRLREMSAVVLNVKMFLRDRPNQRDCGSPEVGTISEITVCPRVPYNTGYRPLKTDGLGYQRQPNGSVLVS